jgi:hypothetical protein
MDMIRFVVLVIFVMLPFVAGLSQRFRTSNIATPWMPSQNDGTKWTRANYTRNATDFETFESSGGSFMKMFVDVGEILPSFLTLESILLVPD